MEQIKINRITLIILIMFIICSIQAFAADINNELVGEWSYVRKEYSDKRSGSIINTMQWNDKPRITFRKNGTGYIVYNEENLYINNKTFSWKVKKDSLYIVTDNDFIKAGYNDWVFKIMKKEGLDSINTLRLILNPKKKMKYNESFIIVRINKL